jgi:hypothetical protein
LSYTYTVQVACAFVPLSEISCQSWEAFKMTKTYYVSVEAEDIQESKLDDHLHYYEIEATKEQIQVIANILREIKRTEYDPKPILTSLNEENGIKTREEQHHLIKNLYEKIYQLGTFETKQEIRSLQILNQL